MELKDQLTAGSYRYSFLDKPFTIIELECLASIRSTDEHESLEREIILEKPCTVIKVRKAGCRSACEPTWQQRNTLYDVIRKVLGIRHSFLNQDDLSLEDVFRNNKI